MWPPASFTFFIWLTAELRDMEVGSTALALRLLFKLLMSSRFFAFSATKVKGMIDEGKFRTKTSKPRQLPEHNPNHFKV